MGRGGEGRTSPVGSPAQDKPGGAISTTASATGSRRRVAVGCDVASRTGVSTPLPPVLRRRAHAGTSWTRAQGAGNGGAGCWKPLCERPAICIRPMPCRLGGTPGLRTDPISRHPADVLVGKGRAEGNAWAARHDDRGAANRKHSRSALILSARRIAGSNDIAAERAPLLDPVQMRMCWRHSLHQ